mgnify:CR=1 FL=1
MENSELCPYCGAENLPDNNHCTLCGKTMNNKSQNETYVEKTSRLIANIILGLSITTTLCSLVLACTHEEWSIVAIGLGCLLWGFTIWCVLRLLSDISISLKNLTK